MPVVGIGCSARISPTFRTDVFRDNCRRQNEKKKKKIGEDKVVRVAVGTLRNIPSIFVYLFQLRMQGIWLSKVK